MNQTATSASTDKYVYVVHGIVPEFMPQVAFRMAKHFGTVNKKIIKCPYCRNPFITVDETAKIELYGHSSKANVTYDRKQACHICRNEVGVIYKSA